MKPQQIWLVGTDTMGRWPASRGLPCPVAGQWGELALSAGPGGEEGLTMSERAPAPGSSGDKPNGEPGALDDEREAALMREVLREQEQHREGGVEPGLDDPDSPQS